jgi:hypothetical protein
MARFERRQHNLPSDVSSFVGRERERAEVVRLRQSTPLLTLVGAGELGKTRLALRVGSLALDDYPDWVWLIELAPLADADFVPQTVAHVPGVREQPGVSLVKHAERNTWSHLPVARPGQLRVPDRACARLVDGCCAPARACPSWPPAASRSALPGKSCSACDRSHCRGVRETPMTLILYGSSWSVHGPSLAAFELTPTNRAAVVQAAWSRLQMAYLIVGDEEAQLMQQVRE